MSDKLGMGSVILAFLVGVLVVGIPFLILYLLKEKPFEECICDCENENENETGEKPCTWYEIPGMINGLTDVKGENPYTAQKSTLSGEKNLAAAKNFVLKELKINKENCNSSPVGLIWSDTKAHFVYGYGYGINYNPSESSKSYIFSARTPSVPRVG